MKINCPQCHVSIEITEIKNQTITCKACGTMYGLQVEEVGKEMIPKKGDRIIIKNIPKDYQFRDLYDLQADGTGLGTIENHFNVIEEKGIVPFYCGYVPYKDGGRISISGSGNSVNLSKVRFIKQGPAPFWKFKNGTMKAHNGENYMEQVNWFECDFNALN